MAHFFSFNVSAATRLAVEEMRCMMRRCSSRRRAAPISSAQARTTPRSPRQMDLSKLDMNGSADSANRQPELGQP
eukprot:2562615-Pyramimonas_sp.AAC.1